MIHVNILIKGTDMNKLIKQLNVELESLCIRFKSNKLSLNTPKTILHFFSYRNNESMDFIMDNQVLTVDS